MNAEIIIIRMLIVHIDYGYNNNFSIYDKDIVPICTGNYDGKLDHSAVVRSTNIITLLIE